MTVTYKTFFDRLMCGETTAQRIHDEIDDWHCGNCGLPLHKYLGMTWEEFGRWVQQDAILETLVDERKNGKPPSLMSVDELIDCLPITAREDVVKEIRKRMLGK